MTLAIRIIRQTTDEILRKKSREVEIVDDKIREILDDMVETMHKYDGVGLAAPQIGILKRLVVIDLYDEKGPIKLVNPKIVKEKGTQEVEEGCLSFPNQFGKVIRPEKVVIEALNENGKKIKLYNDGKSTVEISKIFNCSATSIRSHLKHNGIKMRTFAESMWNYHKKEIPEDFNDYKKLYNLYIE